MNHLFHIEWSWTWPFALFLFLAALLTGVTLWIYRQTLPPVSRGMRVLLIVLRSSALFLIVLALFGAVAKITRTDERPATVALLVDRSMSMEIEDKGRKRADVVKDMLSSGSMSRFARSVELKTFLFSGNIDTVLHGLPDTLDFSGKATGLADVFEGVLRRLETSSPGGILLFSDGRNNSGADPVRMAARMGVPLHTITVGETGQQSDLILSGLMANDIAYIGDEIPVDARIRGPGFGGQQVSVVLQDASRVLDQVRVTLPEEGLEAGFTLSYRPEEPGYRMLTVTAAPLEGELSLENNSQELMIRVLENKIRVFLLCGSPSADLRFVSRILETDGNLTVIRRTEKKGGGFYEGSFPGAVDLGRMDAWILFDFPGTETPASLWSIVARWIMERKPPVMLLGGRADLSKLRDIQPLLPFLAARTNRLTGIPQITPEGELHPVIRMGAGEETRNIWQELPPVLCPVSVQVRPDSRVLLRGIPENQEGNDAGIPLLVVRHFEEEKSLAFLGSGIYRWDLLMWGIGRDNRVLSHFLSQSIRWLSTRETDSRVRLEMEKTLFRSGDEVRFFVQVYDETYRPLEGADVTAVTETPSGRSSIILEDAGMGRYHKTLPLFEKGNYKVRIEAILEGKNLGGDEGEFFVSELNLEFLDTRADPEQMAALASVSGGRSGSPDSLDSIISSLHFDRRTVVSVREIMFRQGSWMLIIILLLLSSEWFIRKRKAML